MKRDEFKPGSTASVLAELRGSQDGHLAALPGEEYEILFESSIDGVLVLGTAGNILRANAAACELFGKSQVQLRGVRRARDLLPAENALRTRGLVDACRLGGRATGTLTVLRSDGTRIEVQVVATRFVHGTEARALIILRKLAEDAGERVRCAAGEQMRSRAANLEAVNAELTNFAGSMSHDLRASLDAIAGFSTALERSMGSAAPARSLHYLQRIRTAGAQIQDHVNSFLSLVEVTGATLADTDVHLSGLAKEVLAELQGLGDGERMLKAQIMDGLYARGDPRLLKMLLQNLLGNAWKFTSGRSVAQIEFSCQLSTDGQRVYRVKDNGVGFDMSYGGKLFVNFQRLHSQAEYPGIGVGLANVRRIVERYGGRVWAESVKGEGASFFFTLAAAPGREPPAPLPERLARVQCPLARSSRA